GGVCRGLGISTPCKKPSRDGRRAKFLQKRGQITRRERLLLRSLVTPPGGSEHPAPGEGAGHKPGGKPWLPPSWCPRAARGRCCFRKTAPGEGTVPWRIPQMPASACPFGSRPNPLHATFLSHVLPRVEAHGRVFFRHVKSADRKEELLAELRGLAWAWYVGL